MNHQTIITTEIEKIEMLDDCQMQSDDDDDDGPSSPESAYDENDLMHVAMDDEVTAQLAAAGPVGVAAAAAIASAKKRKRPHSFETNPSIRKRQQNRLLRKLRVSIAATSIYDIVVVNYLFNINIFAANYIRICYPRRPTSRCTGCYARQTKYQLQSIWCQTT